MSNDLIKGKVLSIIKQTYEVYQCTSHYINHNGLKGTFNEYGFVTLIKELLPKNYSIGKGVIIDTTNSQSCEADVIIYENTDINPILFGPDSGVFPIETCRYVLEIKTVSTAREIQDAIKKAAILKSMKSINGQMPIFSYFAFSSDLTNGDEFNRYYKYEKNISSNKTIDTICVVNNGYWYKSCTFHNNVQLNISWQGIKTDGLFEEVLSFIAGILNTINRKTQMGYYILEDKHVPFVYQNFLNIGFEIIPDKIEIYNEYARYLENNDYENEILTLLKLVDNPDMQDKVLTDFSSENNNPLRKQAYINYITQRVN